MNASLNLVAGIFLGAEIEPGQFHHWNPDCLVTHPADTRRADADPAPVAGTDDSPVAAPMNADNTGVTSGPVGSSEDVHLAGRSSGLPV